MGGGFLWGAFAHAFLCLMVVFTQQAQLLARLLRVDAVDKAIL